jgi:hypothetical protein
MRTGHGTWVAVATAVVAAVLAPAVQAHGDGAAQGYASSVTAVLPATPSLSATVLDGDDRLELKVDGDHVVVIEGYEGEPYLRFTPVGVFRNTRSPATYLNDDRFGTGEMPRQADAAASPAWERVERGGSPYAWHDHRIHWMSESYPPVVQAARGEAHHILDWAVTGTMDGAPLSIRGRLDYAPPPGQRFPRVLVVPLAALAVLAVALPLLRRRHSTSTVARS